MPQATLTGDREAVARLEGLRANVPRALEARIAALAERLAERAAANASGLVLQARSGRLAASIRASMIGQGDAIAATVGVTGPAQAYAAIQEYGGTVTVRAHLTTIRAAWGRPLAGGAKQVAVRAHAAHYPERSFLRAALADMRSDITDGIADAVGAAIAESGS
jgi:phage gpG-like protein